MRRGTAKRRELLGMRFRHSNDWRGHRPCSVRIGVLRETNGMMNWKKKPRKFAPWVGTLLDKRKPVVKAPRKRPVRQRIKQVSKSQGRRNRWYSKVRSEFMARPENKVCHCCTTLGRKPSLAEDVHHMRGKIGELRYKTEYFLPVCRRCHDWIGNNLGRAKELGWVGPWLVDGTKGTKDETKTTAVEQKIRPTETGGCRSADGKQRAPREAETLGPAKENETAGATDERPAISLRVDEGQPGSS